MQILQLTISGFGNFHEETTFEFQPDALGLVSGKNEAGKSTLVAAVFAALYGLKASEKKRWKNWNGQGDFALALTFREGDGEYRVERDLEKNHVRLIRLDAGEDVLYNDFHQPTDKYNQPYLDKFTSVFPLPPPSVLKSSTVIHEHHLSVEMGANLRQMITGTNEEDYEEVLQALEEAYYRLTRERLPWQKRGGRRSEQLLELKRVRRQQIEDRLQESRHFFENQQELQNRLLTAENRQRDILRKLPLLTSLAENLEKIQKMQQEIVQLTAQRQNLTDRLQIIDSLSHRKKVIETTIRESYAELEPYEPVALEKELSAYLAGLAPVLKKKERLRELRFKKHKVQEELRQLPDFSHAPEDLPYLVDEIDKIDQSVPLQQSNIQKLLNSLAEKRAKFRIRLWMNIGTFVAAVGLGLLGYFIDELFIFALGTGVFLLFGSLLLLTLEVLPGWRSLKQVEKEKDSLQERLNQQRTLRENDYHKLQPYIRIGLSDVKNDYRQYQELQRQIGNLNSLIEEQQNELTQLTENASFRQLLEKFEPLQEKWETDLPGRIAHYRDLKNQWLACQNQLKAHPAPDGLREQKETIVQEIASLNYQIQQIASRSAKIAQISQSGQLAEFIDKVRGEIRKLEKEMTDLKVTISALRAGLKNEEMIEYNPDKLREELEEIRSEIEFLEQRRDSLILAQKVLRETVHEFRDRYLSKIQEGIESYLGRILSGSNLRVRVNPDFGLAYLYNGVDISGAQLSSGTRDQLFFGYRLVLADLLTPHFRFPFIVDDAFAHFDSERTARVFQILQNLKKERQFLILSSDTRYRQYCDYQISLSSEL